MTKHKQPKYQIWQTVICKVKATCLYTGKVLEQDYEFTISSIKAAGDSEKDSYKYGITVDMPRCNHLGKLPFLWKYEDQIIEQENGYLKIKQ